MELDQLGSGLRAFVTPGAVPDRALAAYMDAFMEAAYRDERDPMVGSAGSARGLTGESHMPRAVHALMVRMGLVNDVLRRAVEMHGVTPDYIDRRAAELGLVDLQPTEHAGRDASGLRTDPLQAGGGEVPWPVDAASQQAQVEGYVLRRGDTQVGPGPVRLDKSESAPLPPSGRVRPSLRPSELAGRLERSKELQVLDELGPVRALPDPPLRSRR